MTSKLLLLCSVILFIALSALVYIQKSYFPIDLTITKTIQQFNPVWFDYLMKFITNIGYVSTASIVIIFVSIILLAFGKLEEMIGLVISSYGSVYLAEVIKNIISRPRPDPKLILQLDQFTKPDSFPSGHVLFAIGLYGFLAYLNNQYPKKPFQKIIIIICWLIIILMGLSRVYLGDHWFSDVLGSYLLGTIWLYLMVTLYKRYKSTKSKNQDL